MRDKLLNRFIGTMDDRDEYQRHEIHKMLASSGALLWIVTMLLMLFSLIMDTIHNKMSFITPALFIINMAYAFNITVRLRKNRLDDTDCASPEEYRVKKRQLIKSSALSGLLWGFLMLFMMEYLFPYLETGDLAMSWSNTLIWVVAGIIFGLIMYLFGKSKLNKPF
ncbi:hypothetical protein GCM10028778_21780 [Barrientosiimonas marina]|uniref:DUF3278 domain-containing protein n=1 Tax=Lentibacillus kimchii TaxID=1542911 RepID=A0ABW2UWF9_9BACI